VRQEPIRQPVGEPDVRDRFLWARRMHNSGVWKWSLTPFARNGV
jgi:hypothetical protein